MQKQIDISSGFMSQLLKLYQSGSPLSIVEFVEQVLLNGQVNLFLGQKIVLKSFYGEELSPEEQDTLIRWRENEQRTTWIPGRQYSNLILESGRRCVVGSTMLATPSGLQRIDSLASETGAHIETVSARGGTAEMVYYYNQGRQKTYRLVTSSGRTLQGTPNHPVMVQRDGMYLWVPLSDVITSDQILISRSHCLGNGAAYTYYENQLWSDSIWNYSHENICRHLSRQTTASQSGDINNIRSHSYEYIRRHQILATAVGIPSSIITSRKGHPLTDGTWILRMDPKWRARVLNKRGSGLDEWVEQVSSVTYAGYENVYDIHVPGDHAFWGDGFINHNSGKSMLVSAVVLYEFYNLITLNSPAKHYGLVPSDPIHIFVIAQSAEQVKETLFAKIIGYASESMLFQSLAKSGEIEMLATEIRCPGKNVAISAKHSRSQSLVGYNLKLFVLDEASRFETNELGVNTADTLFDNVGKAVSTFGKHGKRVMISSAWCEGDPIQRAYDHCHRDPYSLGMRLTTWHLNHSPNVARDSPQIVSDYLKNEQLARLEYEGIRPSASGGMFTTDMIDSCTTGHSMVDTAATDLDVRGPEETRRYVGINILRCEPSQGPGYGHIDYGLKRDNCAFAFAAPGEKDGSWTINIEGLILWQPRMTDGGIRSVSFTNVEDTLIQISVRRNIRYLSFDQWNSEATIQRLHEQGIVTELLGVSRPKQMLYYTLLRQLLLEGRIQFPMDSIWMPDLKAELHGLVVQANGKIIHPSANKDLADAVACAVWNCHEKMAIAGLMRTGQGNAPFNRHSSHSATSNMARLKRLKKTRSI